MKVKQKKKKESETDSDNQNNAQQLKHCWKHHYSCFKIQLKISGSKCSKVLSWKQTYWSKNGTEDPHKPVTFHPPDLDKDAKNIHWGKYSIFNKRYENWISHGKRWILIFLLHLLLKQFQMDQRTQCLSEKSEYLRRKNKGYTSWDNLK